MSEEDIWKEKWENFEILVTAVEKCVSVGGGNDEGRIKKP